METFRKFGKLSAEIFLFISCTYPVLPNNGGMGVGQNNCRMDALYNNLMRLSNCSAPLPPPPVEACGKKGGHSKKSEISDYIGQGNEKIK